MEHYDWNDGWLFAPTFDTALVRPECPELSLTPVRLPHTVKPLPYNYCNENDYQRLCGYRREFFAPKEWLGRTVLLTFGAVAHDATVCCNGRRVFHHGCGYTAFTVDLTGALRLGQKNVVAVRCDCREDLNIPPFGGQLDALTYGGIYRAVSLDIKEPAYLRDVFIEAKAEGDFRIYTATVGETVGCTLQAEIRSPAGSRAVYSGELSLPTTGTLNNVHPWSLEHPTLYTLTVRLIRPGTGGLPDRVLDEKTVRFGFRTVQFVAGGLYLNGQRVELRGLDRHQSYPYQGYAMPDSIQRRDAQLLKKELGCNAVRTCYAPPSPAFLDACDELGLLVFPEMPGWQHIGDEVWQAQALQNCREMVCQYRNHPSIFLWGARISGSPDNEAFYKRTNEAIHRLDPTRPTAGARNHRKSQLLEDVYAYNDYSYRGRGAACEARAAVTSDPRKGYLISEFGGQQLPTKPFDDETHRLVQALRYAAGINDSIAQQGVAGSFGWCMADYNTHREFGSGDRICYHGVMDMFRNPKLAAAVYSSQQEDTPVLELSSSMDIGEHPGGNRSGNWMITNADAVRMFKNGKLIKEYHREDSPYRALAHGPIPVNDFIGNAIVENEPMKPKQARLMGQLLNMTAYYGLNNLPAKFYLLALRLMVCYHMKPKDAVALYTRYVGDWGTTSTVYKFEAVRDGKVVKTVIKEPMQQAHLEVKVSAHNLTEGRTYDMAAVRIRALDENGNVLGFFNEPVQFEVKGVLELIGPKTICLQGGMGGTYVKTTGQAGEGILTIENAQTGKICEHFQVAREE